VQAMYHRGVKEWLEDPVVIVVVPDSDGLESDPGCDPLENQTDRYSFFIFYFFIFIFDRYKTPSSSSSSSLSLF